MRSILLGAVRTISRYQWVSRSLLFMAMDHSRGSMGGRPERCMARVRTVTHSSGAPGMWKSGKYFTTGSSRLIFPSASRMQQARAVMDLLMEAMPNTVSPSTGFWCSTLRYPKPFSKRMPSGPRMHTAMPG